MTKTCEKCKKQDRVYKAIKFEDMTHQYCRPCFRAIYQAITGIDYLFNNMRRLKSQDGKAK